MSYIDGRWQLPADFLARIRILPPEEGGRYSPPYNGIRWNFSYREADGRMGTTVYMIWPLFYDAEGQPLSPKLPLPVGEWLRAGMYILNQEVRDTLHRLRLYNGASFCCREGLRVVAEGVVTDVSALHA